jgi:hypothetical protein
VSRRRRVTRRDISDISGIGRQSRTMNPQGHVTIRARTDAPPNANLCCERVHHRERSERPQAARQQQAPLGRGAPALE